jgi:hypothetical protein
MADGDWLTATDVGLYLGKPLDTDAWATRAAMAARRWVEERRPDVDYAGPPEHIVTGATMLAARWYLRRNSANGIAGTFESGAYLPRTDRDIEMLLGLRQPKVG